jgi:hypothetical protein
MDDRVINWKGFAKEKPSWPAEVLPDGTEEAIILKGI